jgi:hypothetical protein
MLGPGEDIFDGEELVSFDTSSAGVLNDPSGFGTQLTKGKRPGILSADEQDEATEHRIHHGLTSAGKEKAKEPSVTGALAELHNAVSHKIQSWNPYFAKGSKMDDSLDVNGTESMKSNKKNSSSVLAGESIKDGVNENDRLGAKVRIGKATLLFSGNPYWERCVKTHERHDKEHGYRLHILRQQLMDDVWSKPAFILSILLREMAKPESERLDWLFWVDADTVILNPYVPIETFLPPLGTEFDDVFLMYVNDWNGLNNGVFLIKVNHWAVKLFSAIVSYRHFRPDGDLQFRDQSAMNTLMQEPAFAKNIVQAPQRWFNAYQGELNETLQPFQVRRGDLLVHFAGIPDREARMQYWLERAEQHLDDWEMPVKSTTYPQEAKDFWNQERQKRRDRMEKVVEVRKKASEMMAQTEQRMNDFGDRLNDDEKRNVNDAREELKKVFEDPNREEDVEKLEEAMKKVEESARALVDAMNHSHKLLLQSAHEAIFTGEKDLLGNGYKDDGENVPQLSAIAEGVKNLKTLVMKPDTEWSRQDIEQATNAVTEARARLLEKLEQDEAERNLAEERAKALEDARLAAEMEAGQFVGAQNADGTSSDSSLGSDEQHDSEMQEEQNLPDEEDVGQVEPVVDDIASGSRRKGKAKHKAHKVGSHTNAPQLENDGMDVAQEASEPSLDQIVDEQADTPSNVEFIGVTVTAPGPVQWVTEVVQPGGDVPPQVEAEAQVDGIS